MKFRDGMWLVAEGMKVEYAEEVYRIDETDKGLSLLCPTKKIRGRGDTLNTSTLTIVSLCYKTSDLFLFVLYVYFISRLFQKFLHNTL